MIVQLISQLASLFYIIGKKFQITNFGMKVNFQFKYIPKLSIRLLENKTLFSLMLILLVFIFSCANGTILTIPLKKQSSEAVVRITLKDPIFGSLEKKWISSGYFDRGMSYKNSRLEVVSLLDLINSHDFNAGLDAILLNCADDYQGIISIDDAQKYDLQIALKIELAQGSVRPSWLQPLVIVVPNHSKPPLLERFFTANINELRFVKLKDYYAPLDSLALKNSHAKLGLDIFKNNCLFCHSIREIGGNKGTSLLGMFDLRLDDEKKRFRDRFTEVHGESNTTKQNMGQFLVNDQLDYLLAFLHEMVL